MKEKVFVTRRIPIQGLELIQGKFDTSVWPQDEPPSKEEIIQLAKDCTGLVTLLSDTIDKEAIERLPKLRVISQYAVGYDNIDVKYATEKGIIVTNTPGVLTETTADLTWALIMATARRIVEADRYVREGRWQVAWGPELLLGTDIHGATLGIMGMGRIGYSVAKRASGFNMKVLFYNRSENEFTKKIVTEGAQSTDFEILLRESDIVSLHIPLNSDTYHMIGRREISMMKQGAILINTSRGQVIDEKALDEALKTHHLGGAGLDVFDEEPINPKNSLLNHPNVVITPHIGSASVHTRATMAQMCAENLIAAMKGTIPTNIVNPEVL
ncbi:D-glycerate dehydrogenase [Candidatus Thorarchaeota archaeon]|nr:MAG: D-glycerate dehydrogenase [Candidatus Thorarchaeota archaeon]